MICFVVRAVLWSTMCCLFLLLPTSVTDVNHRLELLSDFGFPVLGALALFVFTGFKLPYRWAVIVTGTAATLWETWHLIVLEEGIPEEIFAVLLGTLIGYVISNDALWTKKWGEIFSKKS